MLRNDLLGDWFEMAVLGCRSFLPVIQPSTKIAVRNFVMKGAYISMTNVWLMHGSRDYTYCKMY